MDNSPDTKLKLQRRKNDFGLAKNGHTLYQGTTCCCCCVHMVGAFVGSIVGYIKGWQGTQVKPSEKESEARIATHLGFILSYISTIVYSVYLLEETNNDLIISFFFVPCLFILPIAIISYICFLIGGGRKNLSIKKAKKQTERASFTPDFTDGNINSASERPNDEIPVEVYLKSSKPRSWFSRMGPFWAMIVGSILGTIIGWVIMVGLSTIF